MIAASYGLFLAIVAAILTIDRAQVKRKWYDPLYIFLIVNVLYVSPLTLRYLFELPIEGNVTSYFYEIRDVFAFAIFANTLALLSFYFFYRIVKHNFFTIAINSFAQRVEKHDLNFGLAGALLTTIGIALFIMESSNYGGVLAVLLSGYAVTLFFLESPLLALSLSIVMTGAFMYLAAYSRSRKRSHYIISLTILICALLVQVILGRRAEIAVWSGAYLIYYSIIIKPIKPLKILIILSLVFLFLNILGLARGANYDDIGSFIDKLTTQTLSDSSQNTGMFYTLTTGQFAVPFETLPMLMHKMRLSDFEYGTTLLTPFLQWIPRGLWESKPYGLAQWYMHTFYDPSSLANEGRQFYYLSEGYVNFGFLGVILWGAIWGCLLKCIEILSRQNVNRLALPSYLSAIYIAGLISLLANDFVGFFVAHPKNIAIWFLIGYISLYFLSRLRIK